MGAPKGVKHNVSAEDRERRRQFLIHLNKTRIRSEEERERSRRWMRELGKTRPHIVTDKMRETARQTIIKLNKTRIQSVEQREKARQNLLVAIKNRVIPAEELRARSERMKIVARLPQSREAARKRMLERWKDPARKDQLVQRNKSRVYSNEEREAARLRMIERNKMGWHKPTTIEMKVAAILLSWGVDFETEKKFPKISRVDFYCPRHKLCIEADGDYWHSKAGVREKDANKDGLLSDLGLRVLRLPEHEINKQPNLVIGKIYNALMEKIECRKSLVAVS